MRTPKKRVPRDDSNINIQIYKLVRNRLVVNGYQLLNIPTWGFYYKKRNIVVKIFPTVRFFGDDTPRAHLYLWIYKKGELINHRLIYNDGIEEFFHYLYTQEGFI